MEEWSDDGVGPTLGIVIAVRSLGTPYIQYSSRKYIRTQIYYCGIISTFDACTYLISCSLSLLLILPLLLQQVHAEVPNNHI